MKRSAFSIGLTVLALGSPACYSRLPSMDDAGIARTPSDLPALPAGTGLRVLVIGDFGTGDAGQREVAEAIAATHGDDPPDLVLTVGDNVYPAGVESVDDPLWDAVFESVYTGAFWEELTFFPTLGNHDAAGSVEAQIRYTERDPRWIMPARYHSFQKPIPGGGTVRFLALDTNLLMDGGDEGWREVEWLDSKLAASDDRWIIAYGHHPILTAGWHVSTDELAGMLLPHLQGWVPLYLAGHNHSTEILRTPGGLLQGVCGGGAGLDNAYRVEMTPETLSAFSNGGWCFLHVFQEKLVVELYNRVGTLLYRHVLTHVDAQ